METIILLVSIYLSYKTVVKVATKIEPNLSLQNIPLPGMLLCIFSFFGLYALYFKLIATCLGLGK